MIGAQHALRVCGTSSTHLVGASRLHKNLPGIWASARTSTPTMVGKTLLPSIVYTCALLNERIPHSETQEYWYRPASSPEICPWPSISP